MTEATRPPTLAYPPADPMQLFDLWYEEAVACEQIEYANAVCLSTIDLNGQPDGRTVFIELHDESGFVFFTDVQSVKARSLAHHPEGALTFYWGPLNRQIRVHGSVEQASHEISDDCFSHRPRGSRITTWASRQSHERDAQALKDRVEAFTERFSNRDSVPRPPRWRAYLLVPRAVELWQAKADRLHDRLLYEKQHDGGWTTRWLDP